MSNSENKSNTNFHTRLFALGLDRRASRPLQQQLTDCLRDMILSDSALPGSRMPSSRRLAAELSVSRVTTLAAFDQLIAEGYLEAKRGAGTFVARDLPHIATPKATQVAPHVAAPLTIYSPFHPGIPDLKQFPYRQWAKHLESTWKKPEAAMLCKPDPAGWYPLRKEISRHLLAWRGIRCSAAQVFITSGSAETFRLIGRALLTEGDSVYIEDPGYAPMRTALLDAKLSVIHSRVDSLGFDIHAAQRLGRAKAAIVTPSRHYPLGMTLPLSRRLALLEWANTQDTLIVEDDYDGEFRYQGQPLPALSALDDQGRVLYVGSFSKLLSPHLRVGYLVVPPRLVPSVYRLIAEQGSAASMTAQPGLATFMQSGEFSIHLRRMRRVYAARQRHLRNLIAQYLVDYLTYSDDPAGMHLVCDLGPKLAGQYTDSQISQFAKQAGLVIRAVSDYAYEATPHQGLILGYAGFSEAELSDGVGRLCQTLKQLVP